MALGPFNAGASSGGSVFYGTCGTAAGTTAKVVTCPDFKSLTVGASIRVKFTYYNTAASPTLNVNSTGAVSIKRLGTTAITAYEWASGEVLDFVYDGSYWVLAEGGIASTTYYGRTKLSSSVSSTSAALAATPYAVKQAYDLANSASTAAANADDVANDAYDIALAKASVTSGQATLEASGWTTDSTTGLGYKTVSISGITASSIVDITPIISTTDADTGTAQQEAWDTHYYAESVAGGVKFWATEVPAVAVEFTWRVVS